MGCSMWRSTIFDVEQYNEDFVGSSLGDDVEFSIRASHYGTLFVIPGAVLSHDQESVGRPNDFLHSYRFVRNRWEIVKVLGREGSASRFWVSVTYGVFQKSRQFVLSLIRGEEPRSRWLSLGGAISGSLAVFLRTGIR